MAPTQRLLIVPSSRGRSREVASFFAQLDDQSTRMFRALAGITPAELAWQPQPGRNTIGMLLAHCALVEAWWLIVARHDEPWAECERRLGKAMEIDPEADGMPLPKGRRAPRALAGWTLRRYRALHDRARRFAKRSAAAWSDAELGREFRRVRPDGSVRRLNARWVLYHVLEHQAGHYGQMLLMRHEYADRRKRSGR